MTAFDKLKQAVEAPEKNLVKLDIDAITKPMMDVMKAEIAKQADMTNAAATAQEFRILLASIVMNVSAGVIRAAYEANIAGHPEKAAGIEAANLATAAMDACRMSLALVIDDLYKKGG